MIQPGFTGGLLDRADALRHDPAGVEAAMRDPAARLLLLGPDYEPALAGDGQLAWTGMGEAPAGSVPVLLGLADGAPRFAAAQEPVAAPPRSPGLLAAMEELRPGEAAAYAAARSVLDWHARHRFCANCGGATEPFRAGWGRRCLRCRAEHFPRVDPVVIMLVEHDNRALLGRQPSWPAGRYSALAGFLEPGESIEEAVAREVAEEAGVRVAAIRYVASQPWPFPSQLMIACIAEAVDDAITLDANELEDAIWVPRPMVAAVLAGEEGPFLPPPPYAIARTLLAQWAAT